MAAFDFTEHRILLADADYDTVARARAAYSLKGLTQFSGIETGKMALSALDVFAPDLIVVALDLPDINGLDLIRQIRAHDGGKFAGLPTLILVARENADQLQTASKLGIDGALRKPLNSGKLLRMTELAIVRSQSSGTYSRSSGKLTGGPLDVVEDTPPQEEPELSMTDALEVSRQTSRTLKSGAKPEAAVEALSHSPKSIAKKNASPLVAETPAVKKIPALTKTAPPTSVASPPPSESSAPIPPTNAGIEATDKKPKPVKPAVKEKIAEPVNLEDLITQHRLWVDSGYREGKQGSAKGLDLRTFEFTEVDLAHIQVVGGRFDGMNLSGTVFRKSNLSGSIFNGATLTGANLAVCRLKMAKFKKADLTKADLRGSDLSKADFSGANLSGCDLSTAFLDGTNLKGANLATAKGLILSQVRRAEYDKTTKLPAYLLQQKKVSG